MNAYHAERNPQRCAAIEELFNIHFQINEGLEEAAAEADHCFQADK